MVSDRTAIKMLARAGVFLRFNIGRFTFKLAHGAAGRLRSLLAISLRHLFLAKQVSP